MSTRFPSGLAGRFPPLDAEARRHDEAFVRKVMQVMAIAGLAGALLFLLFPRLDIEIIRWLIPAGDGRRFPLSGSEAWDVFRRMIMWGYGIFYVVTILAAIRAWQTAGDVLSIPAVRWIYLVACSVAGPLLFTNVWLKDHVGRPRPRSIEEFGGPHEFIPVFHPGGACEDNCSFVSGEVSSMTMIFASLAFAVPAWRKPIVAILLPAWLLSTWIRVGQGGHFPSDCYLAGIFMVLIAAILYRIMVLGQAPKSAGNGHGVPSAMRPGIWKRAGNRALNRFDAVMDPVAARGLALLDYLLPRR